MEKDTIALLERAFGKLGVAAEAGMESLSGYYLAQAWTGAAMCAAGLLALAWMSAYLAKWWREEVDYDSEERRIWATSLGAVAAVFIMVGVACVLPSLVATIASPDGYVLDRLISAVAR